MALSKWTREALEWKASVAAEEAEADHHEEGQAEEWAATLKDCEAALKEDTLVGHGCAVAELMDYLGADTVATEWRAIQVDLARAGALDKDDPTAVTLGHKPRTITVDGVKYIAG